MLAIIQARSNSKRFKNKILYKVNGKPLLWYVYNSVKKSKLVKKIVVAISNKKLDDKVAIYLKKNNIKFKRGDLNNVAKRIFMVVKNSKSKFFIRISGDSPLIDHRIIDRAIKIHKKKKNYDLITNIFPRSFPSGQSVEIIRTDILGKILKLRLDKYFYEHVTPYFYKKKIGFKIKNFTCNKNFAKKKYSIDTKRDLNSLTSLIIKSK
tara:strand:+ start:2791 stop:3414 length:624 start_codon:yes stop_codon:yes gene_type:complete